MRFILILAMFGILLLQTDVSRAGISAECLTQCSKEMSSGALSCPPPGDEARTQCLQDNQDVWKRCIDSCPQAAPADTPKDTPKDTPTDTPKED